MFNYESILINEDVISEMTIEDVKKLKPYWNVQIANFKKGSNEPVFTLLQMAILLNKKIIVGYLLARRGIDINALSRNNQTALMIACEKRVPLDWIEAILKKGGDLGINIKDDYDETALDKCIFNSKAYHLLLKYGAIENKNIMKIKAPLTKTSKYADSLWLNVCGCGTRYYK
ncbi:ankyrin-repeat protein, putative [Plasmodium gallinaceum]|uniref:Ankyrin-repeat protein, putative n=1 Tax=Plasmodium gallinaceum TaxID=5849 RepID=A0A1J1GTQ9_PLAGA|nr:ankyrin-repeat protein, putative [Plasmodium gallinaceum]CRG95627.1 ankyrin-repeat protein, putative [Plasmodium gallinaceum]